MKKINLQKLYIFLRLQTLTLLFLCIFSSTLAYAAIKYTKITMVVDRPNGSVNIKGTNNLQKLYNLRYIYLDLKVNLDDKIDDGVLFSTYEMDFRKVVDCRKEKIGPLPMFLGLEYFLKTNYQNKTITFSIYPGDQTLHKNNIVMCEYGTTNSTFHLTGFFQIISIIEEDTYLFQLRPMSTNLKL